VVSLSSSSTSSASRTFLGLPLQLRRFSPHFVGRRGQVFWLPRLVGVFVILVSFSSYYGFFWGMSSVNCSVGGFHCPLFGSDSCRAASIKTAAGVVQHLHTRHFLDGAHRAVWEGHLAPGPLREHLVLLFNQAGRWVCGHCLRSHAYGRRHCRDVPGACYSFGGDPRGGVMVPFTHLFPGFSGAAVHSHGSLLPGAPGGGLPVGRPSVGRVFVMGGRVR
jgi:hypothetical protein